MLFFADLVSRHRILSAEHFTHRMIRIEIANTPLLENEDDDEYEYDWAEASLLLLDSTS